jgi:elongation factor G
MASLSSSSDTAPRPAASGGDAAVHALRSFALLGATGSGKTALARALLQRAGSSAALDDDALERRHHHTLHATLLHARHHGTHFQIVDTPGLPDLVGHALPALGAVDTAVVLIDGVTGPDAQALRWMAQAEARGLDRVLVVNKIDDPACHPEALLAQLQALFGRHCLPLNLPARGGRDVVDCWFQPTAPSGLVPDFSSVEAAHRALVEQVVEVDAAVVERYFNEGDIDAHELHGPLEQALREGHLVPVCFVSAEHGAGIDALLEAIVHLLPDPTEGNPPLLVMGDGDAARPMTAQARVDAPAIAHVFKLLFDPYLGRLGVVRVHQGRLQRDAPLYLGAGRKPVRATHLYRLQGPAHDEVQSAGPGELVALAKIDGLQLYDVLHDAPDDGQLHLQPPPFPKPVHGLAIGAKRPSDEQRLWETLAKLVAEDPCLRLERHPRTHETVVYGLGELHLRLLLERLAEVGRFEVETRVPSVAYRETVSATAQGQHRHKKQSGGAGQFGEVLLRVEPLPRGSGIVFEDAVKGGAIPGVFMPAVEKGVRQAAEAGVVSGHPVEDVKVTVLDGKHHSVDSKEIAFVIAGRKAFAAAVQAAQPLVLEPVVQLSITVPVAAVGDVTGDLASRRGEVQGTAGDTVPIDGQTVVRARVPLAELTGYQSRLNALTGGQGRYTYEDSHHAPVPPSVQQALVKSWQPSDADS